MHWGCCYATVTALDIEVDPQRCCLGSRQSDFALQCLERLGHGNEHLGSSSCASKRVRAKIPPIVRGGLGTFFEELIWMRMWAEGACYSGDQKRNMTREEGDGGQYPVFTDSIRSAA